MKRLWCWLFHAYAPRSVQRNALIGGGNTTTCCACGHVRRVPCGSRGYKLTEDFYFGIIPAASEKPGEAPGC